MEPEDVIDGLDATARAWMERAVVAERCLSAAEQQRALVEADRDHWKEACAHWNKIGHNLEARAEAAEQALHEIAAADGSNDPTWWGSSPEHLRSIARAALAALAGREETT